MVVTEMTKKTALKKELNIERLLFACAEQILPWLNPADLASISLTCKTLNQFSKIISSRRASDACRSFEKYPVPFLNTVDDQPYSYFVYTASQILRFPHQQQPWGSSPQNPISDSYSVNASSKPRNSISAVFDVASSSGCICKKCSEDGDLECPCSILRPKFSTLDQDLPEMMTECGPNCLCGLECENRSTQQGVSVRLRIVKHRRKGWCLHAAQSIQRGQFVCEYAGELLMTDEVRKRQRKYDVLASGGQFSSALLVVREHLPSGNASLRINIDATRVGNIARFINHSCDGGNLCSILVRSSGALLPRLCFLASRDIQEGEELTFSYGDVRLRPKGLQCFCGSSGCFGSLPSENT